jgi:hypothetical protein
VGYHRGEHEDIKYLHINEFPESKENILAFQVSKMLFCAGT